MPKIAAAEPEKSAVLPASFRLAVTGPGDQHPTIHVIGAPFALIGRARGCSLRLDHPAVSRRHIYLQAVLGRMYCIDLSHSGETILDGTRHAQWLKPDQVLRVGPFEVRLLDAIDLGGRGEQAPVSFSPLDRYAGQLGPMPKVKVEFFKDAAYRTNSTINRLIVLGGSSDACKFRLQEKSVSSIHFSFVLTHDGLWVMDLAGRNGIAVNNRPVQFGRLGDQDELRVGTFLMRVHYAEETGGSSSRSSSRKRMRHTFADGRPRIRFT